MPHTSPNQITHSSTHTPQHTEIHTLHTTELYIHQHTYTHSSTRTAAQLANTRKELSLKEIERQARMLMAERLGVRAE